MKRLKSLLNGNSVLLEFIRYCVVGGTAFVFDFAAFWGMNRFVFTPIYGDGYVKENFFALSVCITVGFVVGLVVNYGLSIIWVFTTKKQQEQGKNTRAFLIFAVIGVIGYFLKLLLMKIEVGFIGMDENIANIIAAIIVLAWNYIARKIFIFNETDKTATKGLENAVE